jgi:predicted membrane GTPase involved in stress response
MLVINKIDRPDALVASHQRSDLFIDLDNDAQLNSRSSNQCRDGIARLNMEEGQVSPV